ncbi:MAG: hypothetical protein KJ971_05425 [Firmicutes bacterium]|nr:hypothetical protein [Bacillota bacterium]
MHVNQDGLDRLDTAKMSVLIASKFLNLSEIKVELSDLKKLHIKSVNSAYLDSNNTIYFHLDWLKNASNAEITLIAFHEVRHVYQKQMIDSNNQTDNKESPEVIHKWKHEFENYNRPTESFLSSDYLSQSIEIDAIAFSHFLMRDMFRTESIIPLEIKQAVINKIKEFSLKYDMYDESLKA